ncbi:hypothetical protein ACVWZV_006030 [Bradyrhizobium sp. GM5.1]
MPAGFISEWWPASNRNDGRLQVGIPGRNKSESAFYYTAIIEDQQYSSIRPLIDWLDYNGYTVVTKATKEFIDASGRRKVKGNMDIELAVNVMELADTSTRWCCSRATATSGPWSRPFSAAACGSP